MSYYGRKAVAYDFEKRWTEGHAAGKVHTFEKSRILAGDFSPIVRELEPGFTEGERHVLSRTRPRGALVRDYSRNVEILYPKPEPEELFAIVVRDVVRHKSGAWRVRFDVFDRRERDLLLRRKPPTFTIGEAPKEEVSDEQVRLDSAYTTNPKLAMDKLPTVRPEDHNVLQMQADERWKNHKQETANTELAKQQVRTIAQTAREYSITATKLGLDPTLMLREMEKRIEVELAELQKAA